MTVFYSEHYAAASTATSTPSALPVPAIKTAPGIHAAAFKTKRCFMDFTSGSATVLVSGEEIRCFSLESADRISQLRLSTGVGFAGSTALTIDVGVYETGGETHDGVVVDADIFASAVALHTAALGRTTVHTEAATVLGVEKGTTLWEQLGLSEDPRVTYDIVCTVAGTVTAADHDVLMLECEYSPANIN